MLEALFYLAVGTIISLIVIGVSITLWVRYANEKSLRKATNLSKEKRALNREVAHRALSVCVGARLDDVKLAEDTSQTYVELRFSNGYTATIAAAHSHLGTIVMATQNEREEERA